MSTATTMLADSTLGLSAQALAILAMLSAEDSDDTEMRIDTRAWYNGRENGVSLTVRAHIPDTHALIITIAEHRISDAIAIEIWEMNGDIPDPPTPKDCVPGSDHRLIKYGRLNEATHIIRAAIKLFVLTERRREPLVRVAEQAVVTATSITRDVARRRRSTKRRTV